MNIEFLDDIKSETIIICKSGFKNYILKQKNAPSIILLKLIHYTRNYKKFKEEKFKEEN